MAMSPAEKKVHQLITLIQSEEDYIADLEASRANIQREIAERRIRLDTVRYDLTSAARAMADQIGGPTEELYCLKDDAGDWWASRDGEGWFLATHSGDVFNDPGPGTGKLDLIVRNCGVQDD